MSEGLLGVINRQTLVAGMVFYSALALVWASRGYEHAVSFGVGAVFSIAVVVLGMYWIGRMEQSNVRGDKS